MILRAEAHPTGSRRVCSSEWILNGTQFGTGPGLEPETSMLAVDWTLNGVPKQSTVLILFFENDPISGGGTLDGDYIFVLDGDPLPAIVSPDDWEAFEQSIDFDTLAVPTGAYGPQTDIPLSSLGGNKNQNDKLVGTSDADMFESGAGNDVVRGLDGDDHLDGGAGKDKPFGGNGNDRFNPGDNTSYDDIIAGKGNDTVDFSDLSVGYAGLLHFDLNRRIVVDIDAGDNTGTINKGSNGTTTILDVKNPVEAGNDIGGLGIFGTGKNDIFNVAFGAKGGWISLSGEAGDDTFNISTGGSVRLDYRSASTGVKVNLTRGKTTEDGFGGTDTINGQVWEVRTSMQDDRVIGTDEHESVILMAGNDFADGRGGFDRLRYDRTGVDGVTADLEAETATGTWRGESFTHTIRNFEDLRGSNGSDDLTGANDRDNRIDGRDGDDVIKGGNRSDTLIGGNGNDDIAAGRGRDDVTVGNGADKLNGVGGNDTVRGGAGNDKLKGGGGDKLFGDDGKDRLEGGSGRDTLNGGNQNDLLLGGGGRNGRLIGGGGKGNDVMTGGGGIDTFVFSPGDDTIRDFASADRIDLRGVASITGFKDLKNNHTENVNGDLVIDDLAGNTLILNGISEASLQKDDFIF
jgi:Ca2+-binding RTX toxin-like protein